MPVPGSAAGASDAEQRGDLVRGVPREASEQLRGRASAQLLRDLDAMDAATPDDGANMEESSIKGAPLAAQGWTPKGAEVPGEFMHDGEPSSVLAARAALAWSAHNAPRLLQHWQAAEGHPDDPSEPGDLDAREKLSGALAKHAASELRAAGDDASRAVRLAAEGDKGVGGDFTAQEFARRLACAERAFYFARWLAAAVAWEHAADAAEAADLPQAPGALRGTAEGDRA